MGLKTRDKKIGDLETSVTELPARRAVRLKTKLIKLLGPSLGKLADGMHEFTEETLDNINVTTIGDAIEKLADRLNENDYVDLIMEILQHTRIGGREVTEELFDDVFAGRLDVMYKVVMFTLEVNYGSFFGEGGIGHLFQRVRERAKMPQGKGKK